MVFEPKIGKKNENCENTFFSKSKKWIFSFFGSKISSKNGPKGSKLPKTLKIIKNKQKRAQKEYHYQKILLKIKVPTMITIEVAAATAGKEM